MHRQFGRALTHFIDISCVEYSRKISWECSRIISFIQYVLSAKCYKIVFYNNQNYILELFLGIFYLYVHT